MSTAVMKPEQNTIESTPQSSQPARPGPDLLLTQTILGSLNAQAVYVAAKLGVADSLATGPKSVDQLAKEVGADESALYRVLRALASIGVFAEDGDRTFRLTPTAELLRSDVAGSLRDVAIFMGEDWHWSVWGQTLYSVKTGEAAWNRVHGKTVFPYFETNAEAAEIFDRAMSSFSTLAIQAVVNAYDFSSLNVLVDVAGGQGRLLTGILAAAPDLRGVLFDLPHVITRAKESRELQKIIGSRIDLKAGDFFQSVPVGADGYILKHIIHDWKDDEAIRILTNIRKAISTYGRVLLIEAVVSEGNEPDFAKILDIEMLVSPGGKERTATEYANLFRQSGLKLSRIIPTRSPYSVIEAVKA
ncbi:MAG TPA: methyltransferase [Pyrinomonadaceae bacterium]|nr:methyltransferase [Pyrinomonadaceae bacterium]